MTFQMTVKMTGFFKVFRNQIFAENKNNFAR